jgi:hypothetical protein
MQVLIEHDAHQRAMTWSPASVRQQRIIGPRRACANQNRIIGMT